MWVLYKNNSISSKFAGTWLKLVLLSQGLFSQALLHAQKSIPWYMSWGFTTLLLLVNT